MKVALHGRKVSDESLPYAEILIDTLRQRQATIYVSNPFHELLKSGGVDLSFCHIYDRGQSMPDVDFMVSVGGDGTLLETVTYVRNTQIPILGVNTGRLGFLATVSQDNISEAIDAIYQNNFHYDYRSLIALDSQTKLPDDLNFALNEFTVIKQDTSAMIVVHTYIDGMFLNSYWSDGLIISTPTGSTGYSLSCGGPVVSPHSNNFIITPVSPHNLTVRPLVVSENSVISLQVESRSKNFLLSLDSRAYTMSTSCELTVRKSDFQVRLIKFHGNGFLDTLRQKLNWGLDVRN
jgi:NAD+ kinase